MRNGKYYFYSRNKVGERFIEGKANNKIMKIFYEMNEKINSIPDEVELVLEPDDHVS